LEIQNIKECQHCFLSTFLLQIKSELKVIEEILLALVKELEINIIHCEAECLYESEKNQFNR
jgi:hypothetical protein